MTQSPRARGQWMNPPRRVHPFPTATVNTPPSLTLTPTVNTPPSLTPTVNTPPPLTPTPTVNTLLYSDPNSNAKAQQTIHTSVGVWIFFENYLADRIKFIIFVGVRT